MFCTISPLETCVENAITYQCNVVLPVLDSNCQMGHIAYKEAIDDPGSTPMLLSVEHLLCLWQKCSSPHSI